MSLPKAEEALQAIRKSDVTTVNLINQLFPSERSLEELGPCIAALEAELDSLDEEIRKGLSNEAFVSTQSADVWKEMSDRVNSLVSEVCATVARVRDTKEVTDSIASGIKLLDRGKENLTHTIGALERLLMFETAAANLGKAAAERDYGKCADLVNAVKSLGATFDGHDIEGVREILREKDQLFADLKVQLMEDITSALEDPQQDAEHAVACCLAADALSADLKTEILMSLCVNLLEPYKRNFVFVSGNPEQRTQAALHALDTIERRFQWLKRTLKENEHRFSRCFPPLWKADFVLATNFGVVTRQQLVEVLEACANAVDPAALLKALQKVRQFEDFLKQRFEEDSFVGSISRVFDAFLGGWYRREEARVAKLISAANSDDPINPGKGLSGDDHIPRKIYASSLSLFRTLKDLHTQAETIGSPQMAIDTMKITRQSLRQYMDLLYTTKVPLGIESADLCSYTADHIFKLPPMDVDTVPRPKNNNADVTTFFACCATVSFVGSSLPSLAALLKSSDDGLSREIQRTWVLKNRCNRLILAHFNSSVIQPQLIKSISATPSASSVSGLSSWVKTFMDHWVDYHTMLSEYLSQSHLWFIFELCGLLVVTELAKVLATDLAPLTPNKSEQLLLDSGGLLDMLPRSFSAEMPVRVVSRQLEAIPIFLKILGASFAQPNDLETTTAPYRLVWNEFLGRDSTESIAALMLQHCARKTSSAHIHVVDYLLDLRSS